MATKTKKQRKIPEYSMYHEHVPDYEDATICVKSELDLFERPKLQTAIVKSQEISYKPIAHPDSSTALEFRIPGHDDLYKDLSTMTLYLKVQLVKPDGSLFEAKDNSRLGVINNLLHSMFSQCSLALNGRNVSLSDDNYHYKSYIETLLSYGKDAADTHLISQLFFMDEMGSANTFTASDSNNGFKKRLARLANSSVVEMCGRIHHDFCSQHKLLLPGVNVHLKLTRAKQDFFLFAGDDSEGSLRILDATLTIMHKDVNPRIKLAHSDTLSLQTAFYKFNRTEVKTFSVSTGSTSFSVSNAYLGELPKVVLFCMVKNQAFTGSLNTNPLEFSHFDLNFFAFYVDGNQIPEEAYVINSYGMNRGSLRAYQSLFTRAGIDYGKGGNLINAEAFNKGYFMIAQDLSADCAALEDYISPTKKGELRLEGKFSTPLTETVTIILLAVFNASIEIDENRNIIRNF